MSSAKLDDCLRIAEDLKGEIRKAIVGQDETIDLMLIGLIAGGHSLIEGVPGSAKTLLAQAFAASLSLRFGRIQFTPDLMPGDVLGTNLFNFQTNEFVLTKGAIFTDLLLADEINRSPPKTQAALLQAMNEHVVTIDGRDYALDAGFMVIATQNPIEQQGTYPLPEAQLDRFLFKIVMDYPERDAEIEIIRRHGSKAVMPRLSDFGVRPVADLRVLSEIRSELRNVTLSEPVIEYIVDIVRATRDDANIQVGASSRAANMVAVASRAYAALQGRDFAIPDDIKYVLVPALRHRIVPSASAEIEGLTADQILRQMLERVVAPR